LPAASARFYGSATFTSSAGVGSGTIEAVVGGIVCGSGQAGDSGSYAIPLQASPGCTNPGATVSFWLVDPGLTAGGEYSLQTGAIPSTPGSGVLLNLVFPT